jgi:hypothetical protein
VVLEERGDFLAQLPISFARPLDEVGPLRGIDLESA